MFNVCSRSSVSICKPCSRAVAPGTVVGLNPSGVAVPAGDEVAPIGIVYHITEFPASHSISHISMGHGIYRTNTWVEDCGRQTVPGDSLYVQEGVLTWLGSGKPAARALDVFFDNGERILEFLWL